MMWRRCPGPWPGLGALLWTVLLTACGQPAGERVHEGPGAGTSPAAPGSLAETVAARPTAAAPPATALRGPAPVEPPVWGYTYHRPDGNRLADGHGRLPDAAPLDVPLSGVPAWVVAAPMGSGALWAVVLDGGAVSAFQVQGGRVTPWPITPSRLEPGRPPLLRWDGESATLLLSPAPDQGPTHPVPLPGGGQAVSLADGGFLVQDGAGRSWPLDLAPLPDGRILTDESGRLLLLTEPTGRYGHGVLGDAIEAGGMALVNTRPAPPVVRTISLEAPLVIEGLAPIWADLNGDGRREVIVTGSSSAEGARLLVYDEHGNLVAAGPPIGLGNRWRHQLAVAPFGVDGQLELTDVLTPHIGGVVEFFRWEGDRLRLVAQVPGYTSHLIGSRNLDMAIAGDLDGDGRPELLLPNQARRELSAIRRTIDGAEVGWTMPVGGPVVTNLAAVTLADGLIQVGVGREDRVLRLWGP